MVIHNLCAAGVAGTATAKTAPRHYVPKEHAVNQIAAVIMLLNNGRLLHDNRGGGAGHNGWRLADGRGYRFARIAVVTRSRLLLRKLLLLLNDLLCLGIDDPVFSIVVIAAGQRDNT